MNDPIELGSNWPCSFGRKSFESTNGRRTEAAYSISSPGAFGSAKNSKRPDLAGLSLPPSRLFTSAAVSILF